jgi:hypothetical protein
MNDFKSFTIQELEQQDKSNLIKFALSCVDKVKQEFSTDSQIQSIGIFEPIGYYPFVYVNVVHSNQTYVSTVNFDVSGVRLINDATSEISYRFMMKGDESE